jgi:propane 2-monooxygenase small subunit
MQLTAPQGDFVTPTLMGAGESDVARDARVSRALFGLLSNDEARAEENRATMRSWLEVYTPMSVAAARAPQPIWPQPGVKVIRFEESLEHARRRLVGDLNLTVTEGDVRAPRRTACTRIRPLEPRRRDVE